MPTSRPRHTITETDELTGALDEAAARWPEESSAPSKLLLRLVRAGREAVRGERDAEQRRRAKAIRDTSGALTGVYPTDYLERLRDDWPA